MHCAKIRVFTVIKFGAKYYGAKDIMNPHLVFYLKTKETFKFSILRTYEKLKIKTLENILCNG